MINQIPETWNYDESLEMLLLFYQYSEELLSEITYSLPLHNSLSLLIEIQEIYDTLQKYNIVNEYYSNYIPIIIDEFIGSLEKDYILKKIINYRLNTIVIGFKEAKGNHVLLQRWVEIIEQTCSNDEYREAYKNEIINLVTLTNNKKDLLYCIRNYFICLISEGYTREFLYVSIKKFFDNRNININNTIQIKDFLSIFSCKNELMSFLILMDIGTLEYIDGISGITGLNSQISKIDIKKERESLCSNISVKSLFREYDSMIHNANGFQKIAIIKFEVNHIDQYIAVDDFEYRIKFMLSLSRYFKHFYPSRQIYKILYKNGDNYFEIKPPSQLLKRPFIKQDIIDSRIKNIFQLKAMSKQTFNALAHAIEMHAEALDSKSLNVLLRNFWTSLETLFSNPTPNTLRKNVIDSIIPIIQKTYILKILRTLYDLIIKAIEHKNLKELDIIDFNSFVKYFSIYSENSTEMKKIYSFLSNNPLLRSRIFETRKNLSTGKKINDFLDKHEILVEWQLKRLYRTRNIATHIGEDMSYIEIVVNHLHNYFDYVVNYILCKSENDNYISNISVLVFESENDNRIHKEMLKSDEPLSTNNYIEYLFGPDKNIINYVFEI
ncbi:MAG: hypothetical protein AB9835_01505 [Eubacteriales bacterium]